MNNITKVWTIINNVCRQYRKVEKSREAIDILNEAEKEIFDIMDSIVVSCENCPSEFENVPVECLSCQAIQDYMRNKIAQLKEGE